MAKGTADLENLVKFARANGIKHLRSGTIEFEFFQPATPISQSGSSLASLLDTEEKPPTEDEMFFYSTPHFDQLRAQREKKEPA